MSERNAHWRANSRTGGFTPESPEIQTFESGISRGSTTFAITPAYRISAPFRTHRRTTKTNARAYPEGQTLGQTANFRQTAPEIHVSPGFAAYRGPPPRSHASSFSIDNSSPRSVPELFAVPAGSSKMECAVRQADNRHGRSEERRVGK